LSVILQQISTLHARTSGLGANHESVIDILESNSGIARTDNLL
jgi:hypothetical protein